MRKAVLRAHSWNCATRRAKLAESATAPSWGFDSAYTVPADYLRILEVDTDDPWRVEGRQILADGTGELSIRYICDLTDSQQFDSSLAHATAVMLAAEICERITDSTTKRESLLAEFNQLIEEARANDGEEQSAAEFEEDIWVTVRV